jgi:hypothetical protein
VDERHERRVPLEQVVRERDERDDRRGRRGLREPREPLQERGEQRRREVSEGQSVAEKQARRGGTRARRGEESGEQPERAGAVHDVQQVAVEEGVEARVE